MRNEDRLRDLVTQQVLEVLVWVVFVLMRSAIEDKMINEVVEIRETTTTRGGCRIRKEGDMAHQNGASVIKEINREVMTIAEVRRGDEICSTAGASHQGTPRRTWSGGQETMTWT